MGAEVADLAERLAAEVALVRFLSGVNSPVSLEVVGLRERLVADVAHVALDAGVQQPVPLQDRGLGEGAAARVAPERTVSGVHAPVSGNLTGVAERTVTDAAAEITTTTKTTIIMRPSSLGGGRILRRTLSVRLSVGLSVRPSRYRMLLFYFTAEPSYERTSKIEKLLFSLMGQRHVCTFRQALRAAYRTAISAVQDSCYYYYYSYTYKRLR